MWHPVGELTWKNISNSSQEKGRPAAQLLALLLILLLTILSKCWLVTSDKALGASSSVHIWRHFGSWRQFSTNLSISLFFFFFYIDRQDVFFFSFSVIHASYITFIQFKVTWSEGLFFQGESSQKWSWFSLHFHFLFIVNQGMHKTQMKVSLANFLTNLILTPCFSFESTKQLNERLCSFRK